MSTLTDPRAVMQYRHTQIGYGAPIVLALVLLVLSASGALEDAGQGDWVAILTVGPPVVLAVLFISLTVEIEDGVLAWYFGPRFWKNAVPVDEIADCEPVRNRPTWGWGIRRTRRGWLYNVWGLDAVELTRTDGTVWRIGTDEPERLCRAIREAREDEREAA
jgi:hypothetical protein